MDASPFDGPRDKVRRAREQLNELRKGFGGFWVTHPNRIVEAEEDVKTGKTILRFLTPDDALPVRWSILVGEIAYNLHSALDQLVCQLAVLKDATVDCSKTGFPICLYGPRSKAKRKRGEGRWNSRRMGYLKRTHRAMVKRLQPYHRGNGGRLSPLWLLHEVNNADKHRRIQLFAFTAQVPMLSFGRGSPSPRWFIKKGVRLVNGAKVGYVESANATKVKVDYYVTPQVCFSGGCDAVTLLPVVPTLQNMVNHVEKVVELFAGNP